MTEQRHQRLQAHPGVDQGGGVGVAQLVRGDVQRGAGAVGQPGRGDRVVEAAADPGGADALATEGQQEVGGPVVAGMRQRALRPRTRIHASSASSVGGSSGTTRSVLSLPSGTFSQAPCPGRSHRQSSSSSQLAQAQPGPAQQGDPDAGGGVGEVGDGGH